jgi:hypothetical protein
VPCVSVSDATMSNPYLQLCMSSALMLRKTGLPELKPPPPPLLDPLTTAWRELAWDRRCDREWRFLWVVFYYLSHMCGHTLSFLLVRYLEAELLGHIVILYFNFWRIAKLFLPLKQIWFLCILLILVVFWRFNFNHPNRYEVRYHCGVHLHVPNDLWPVFVFWGKYLSISFIHF